MSPPALPDRLGNYRILSALGQGGMATVHKAVQDPLGREVAIKLVLSKFAADPIFAERFLSEARSMARISHPHVVTCYDAGNVDGRLYMAVELMSGGDLLGLLERRGGRLPEDLALDLLRDCLDGLEALEAAKLVHRDLKPANVFLDDRGRAKLADFGLAMPTSAAATETNGNILGTPSYMPPEQARGDVELDVRADLYALGATLYHLFTGKPPFQAESALATLVQVLNDPVPDPRKLRPDLSEGAANLCLRLMQKDREQRPASARLAREMLERLRAGAALAPLPPPLPVTTQHLRPVSPSTAIKMERGGQSPAIDVARLAQLAKRILIDPDGLKACIALAPGASFPRTLLIELLDARGVTYGRKEQGLLDATRQCQSPRRITLAQGDPPSPDRPGRNVGGEVVPPLAEPVQMRVSEDGMLVSVCYRLPGPYQKTLIGSMLAAHGVIHGIDTKMVDRLAAKPPASGVAVLARGVPAKHGFGGGFRIPPAKSTVDDGGVVQLDRVAPGQVLGPWCDSEPEEHGRDVRGREIAARSAEERYPDSCAGPGTEVGRDRDGLLVLRATRAGVVQVQPDGAVRVVGVVEISGDLTAAQGALVTDDVVVVRGNLKAGAVIQGSGDVLIVGDIEDAEVHCGGNLQVAGTIKEGTRPIETVGEVHATDIDHRRITAHVVRIDGEIRHCEIEASGDVRAGRIVGGSVSACGAIQAEALGDGDGTVTLLWAGCQREAGQEGQRLRKEEARIETARQQMLETQQRMRVDFDDIQLKHQRLTLSQYAKTDAMRQASERLKETEDKLNDLRGRSEDARQRLAGARERRTALESPPDAKSAIAVTTVAYAGVTARIADAEPVVLGEPRLRFKLAIG